MATDEDKKRTPKEGELIPAGERPIVTRSEQPIDRPSFFGVWGEKAQKAYLEVRVQTKELEGKLTKAENERRLEELRDVETEAKRNTAVAAAELAEAENRKNTAAARADEVIQEHERRKRVAQAATEHAEADILEARVRIAKLKNQLAAAEKSDPDAARKEIEDKIAKAHQELAEIDEQIEQLLENDTEQNAAKRRALEGKRVPLQRRYDNLLRQLDEL